MKTHTSVDDLVQDNERFQKDYTVFTFKLNGVPIKFVALTDANRAIETLEDSIRADERANAIASLDSIYDYGMSRETMISEFEKELDI